ncbi:MAG: hypothetical protein U5K28_05225 [Halobacteriales archaeon]|nr:hypothetical protein [Halobacteriales archaeon]
MVSFTRVCRIAGDRLSLSVVLSAAGLLALDTLNVFPRPTVLRAGFVLAGAIVALVLFVASRDTSSGGGPVRRLSPALATKARRCPFGSGGRRCRPSGLAVGRVSLVLLPIGLFVVALQLRNRPRPCRRY